MNFRLAIILFAWALSFTACAKYPSGTLVFVTNERDGTISVIDAAADKVIDTIMTGGRPRGIRISANNKHAYVAVSTPLNTKPKPGDDRVCVYDTSSGALIRTIQVGVDPEQLAIDQDERRLYVSNEDTGTATVIDIANGKVPATLVTGIEPEGASISPDGRWVYVTAETSNTVTVIDTSSLTVADTILVGARPRDTAFSPDGSRAYVSAEIGQSITVIDVETHKVINTVSLAYIADVKPVGMAVSSYCSTLYIANGRANTVTLLETSGFSILKTIAVGQRVWGIALSRTKNKVYAANGLSNDVSVIDTNSNSVVATITAGQGPWGVAVRE